MQAEVVIIMYYDKSNFSELYRAILTYTLAVWSSVSLGLFNYRRPFFPLSCLLSPSFNLHLLQIFLYILQPSQSRSSHSLFPFGLLLNIFLTVLPLSILTVSSPFQFLFNICCFVQICIQLPQFQITSYFPYSLLYRWFTYP